MAAGKATRKARPRRAQREVRAHGEESRQRILDAATQIAGERGYDGTSIALVSERSGLPASSIYWHFESKDQLLAAVIERSYQRYRERVRAWSPPREGASREERFEDSIRRAAAALTEAPDFLRLGLMLVLERRPEEATARRMFLQAREHSYKGILASYETFFAGELDSADLRSLATLTMAAADGLFVAHQVEPSRVDLDAAFHLLANAVTGAAAALKSRSDRTRRSKR